MAERKNLKQLFLPIFFELLFFILVGSVDTLMLSGVGDDQVGAVGAANTYLALFTISFAIISNGMLAVMTQYIGAGKLGVSKKAKYIGLIFNGIIGSIISIAFIFFSKPILSFLGVSENLLDYSVTYMQLVGGSSLITAIIPIYTAYLRAFGHTKAPLIANVISNIINIILNGIFIYVLKLGVFGAALATLISRSVSLLILFIISTFTIRIPKDAESIETLIIIRNLLKIGLPAALENALYNLAMALVMKGLNMMDESGLYVTVKSYASQVAALSYTAGNALAISNSIMVGWMIGENKIEECYKQTFTIWKKGVLINLGASLLIASTSFFYMHLFTDNPEIIRLCIIVLFIDVILEIGRTSNLIFGQALKTAGDAIYIVVIGVIFMFIFAVGGTFLFGVHLKLYVIGCWISLALDELVRAVLMYRRWKSGIWKQKVFIKYNKQSKAN